MSANLTGKHQVSTGGVVTQNEPGGIVSLTAQAQQILVKALRQIEFAAVHVIARLPIGNLKEFRGKTQLLPQLSCAGIGMACFRCPLAFDSTKHRAQGDYEIRAPVADVRGCPAAAPVGPTPFDIARPLPPSPSGLQTCDRPCPRNGRIFQPARLRRNAARRARAECPSARGNELRAPLRSVRAIAGECYAASCHVPRPAPAHV